ncbi:hypothetical protein [Phycicoccus flavus]|uniref:DUF1772 domain-containing protein n=1 Tax=Phycicoccus flavus TaxID=2502783 RepID=A0A8T6R6Z0_9MICO|nr:hypothetical protein [Phycicoccus flavus]NHA69512.1 hypothetical protein [Phycicoccus flavus]
MAPTPVVVLALVAAWHAAFQSTVTLIVYPTLAAHPRDRFAPAHDAHSRRILALVVPTYAAVLGAGTWVLVAGPRTPVTLVAVLAQGLVLAVTALAAAPTHGALGREGPTPALLRRLRLADAARTVLALAGLAVAAAAVLTAS